MRPIVGVLLVASCGRVAFDPLDVDCSQIAITPAAAHPNFDSHLQFTGTGGLPPYTFTRSGVGTVTPQGMYFSESTAGTATVTVTDANSCTASAELQVGGDQLWYVGGVATGDVPTSQVWRSFDGLQWTQVGNLPAARHGGALVVFDDRMWLINGRGNTGDFADVLVSADGVTWTVAADFSTGNWYPAGIAYREKLWSIGGWGLPGEVLVSTDGSAWDKIGHLPLPLHGGGLAVKDGKLWYLGGHDGVLGSYYPTTWWTTDGVTWNTAGSFATERELVGVFVVNNTFVTLGGVSTGPDLDEIVSSPDGITWTQVGTLPVARYYSGYVEFDRQYWSIGGTDGGGVWTSPDAVTWTVRSTTFPAPRNEGHVVVFTPP
ncbi:MAG: hypothetical protein IPQ07_14865 [Myxococcales bacterium]|nr:hypothetical protein [Myxococcales bacterium]